MRTKEEILEEIRRTAKKNGGIPLGITRFQDETKIKESEWEKYWPRFGDAQTEAGFKKNIFGTDSYDPEYVFEKYIELSRELGKLAVSGEWKVKRYNDSNFPSINSFDRLSRRLGSRYKFLTELMKYAKDKGYKDIVKLCTARLEKEKNNELEETLGEAIQTINFGYVYLGKRGYHYKVGVTNNLPRRKIQLETLQPEDFEYIHVIKTDDPYKIEAYWKTRFEPKRLKNTDEWFKLNSSDVRAFDRWVEKIF